MLKNIFTLWKAARGTELFKQIDEICSGALPKLNDDAMAAYADTIMTEMPALRARTGNFTNVSAHGKRQLAKSLMSEARRSFDFNVGRGSAFAVIAIYIESAALPGADATLAHTIAGQMIEALENAVGG